MSKKAFYIFGILLTIILGTWLFNRYSCPCKGAAGIQPQNPFVLSGEGLDFYCSDGFRFPLNGSHPVLPVSDSVNTGISLLKEKMAADQMLKLVLTGFCMRSESGGTQEQDLAAARADQVKSFLVSQGLSSERMDTFGQTTEMLPVYRQYVFNGIAFRLVRMEYPKPEPLVLHFGTGLAKVKLVAEEEAALDKFRDYLEKVTGSELFISGHTDNTGSRASNLSLGKSRAEFVVRWLEGKGIPEARMVSVSAGPDEPVADNSTAAGKAENRRVIIKVK